MYRLTRVSNSMLESPQGYTKMGSFKSGATVSSPYHALLYEEDGYYYAMKDCTSSTEIPSRSSPTEEWRCLGLLNGFPINDIRNFGTVNPSADSLPLIRKAYSLLEDSLILPSGKYRIVLTDELDPVRQETYPQGILFYKDNFSLIFEKGAVLEMDAVESGRYNIISAYNASGCSIINPQIVGDVGRGHGGVDGEWGYGIRVYNCKDMVIHEPNISKCWGDGILWFNPDISKGGGSVTGQGVYTECRRQGISIISCNSLYIENAIGRSIGGAANGPWATIDVEPDLETESIMGLRIGKVHGENNQGPSLLIAVHQLKPASTPIDISVGEVTSLNCQRSLEVRGDGGVRGIINIDSVVGRNSKNQEFQTVKWLDTCKLHIDKFVSINPNKAGDTSSLYGVAIGIYNNYAGGTMGGISIEDIRIINPTTRLTHPIAIVNREGGAVGEYTFRNIVYDTSNMTYGELHNPAGAKIKTNTVIYREYASSGTMENTRWANGIRNTKASGNISVTVPSGYGFDGMEITAWCNSNNQIAITFQDKLEGKSTDVRTSTQSKLTVVKMLSTWVIKGVQANVWSQGGIGRYSYGIYEGGSTGNRPAEPKPWQTYFDSEENKLKVYRQDQSKWVDAIPSAAAASE